MSTAAALASLRPARLALLLALAGTAAGCGIQGSGRLIAEERPVAAFSSIAVTGEADVHLVAGKGNVTVTTDDNLLPYVEVVVSGSELRVGTRDGVNLSPTHGVEVEVPLAGPVSALRISGSGSIASGLPGPLTGDALSLGISGSGSLDLPVQVTTLTLDVSGSGSARLRGSAGSTRCDASGSGSVQAYDLQSKAATVHLSGSGSVELSITDQLEAHLSGSGSIHYRGSPRVTTDDTGSGSVVHEG